MSDRYDERLVDRYDERNDLPLAPNYLLSFVCYSAHTRYSTHTKCLDGRISSCRLCIKPFGSRAARYIDDLVYMKAHG